jgi:hypothetical protein
MATATAKAAKARFRTMLLSAGKTATGFEVPAKVVETLGAGKRPPVRVTIKGFTYRNTVAVYGGKFLVGVSAENREGAGVAAGDMLDVELELDSAPREVVVPRDLAAALKKNKGAKQFFDGLSYSRKQWFVLSIEGAKTAETRERRLVKAMTMLSEGRPPG